jgi:glycine/D-amino acid oxidase-like deaminating enzyme
LPLDGTKGEIIMIKAPDLHLNAIVNASLYIVPLENDFYNVGATYNWEDKTNTPTEVGKKELVDKLKEIISCDFEIISHKAGVRPTVKDRRTLIGKHPDQNNMFILNGLGTRGVLLAPFLAKLLFEFIEYNSEIDQHYSVSRYDKLFFNR